jgi:HEAT repeat protein
MRKLIWIFAISILLIAAVPDLPATAGDLPVADVDFIRKMLLLPDNDFTVFDETELCDAFIYLIETDDDERVVHNAIASIWITGDERAVPYLIDYLDECALDCLYGLGWFSTVESFDALAGYLDDEDEYNRRFSAQSMGNLDYTVSDEMWALRERAIDLLRERLEIEEKEWILPILEEAVGSVESQVRDDEEEVGDST